MDLGGSMTIHERNIFLSKEYEEAVRYMNNALESARYIIEKIK
jgi:hypothetical protein